MAEATLIDRVTGVQEVVSFDSVALNDATVVVLPVERADIAAFSRQGENLVIQLTSGETITVEDFYATWPDGEVSELVLRELDGSSWWLRDESGLDLPQYSELKSVDQLLAADVASSGALGGIGATGGGLLGAAALVGGLAAAMIRPLRPPPLRPVIPAPPRPPQTCRSSMPDRPSRAAARLGPPCALPVLMARSWAMARWVPTAPSASR